MTTVELNLPDDLAQQAREAGLLAPDRVEAMMREALRKRSGQNLLDAMRRMHAANDPSPMTMDEISAEVKAVRAGHSLQSR